MEKAKLLIKELAELTSTEINFTADNICEIVVEDRLILLRYRPEDNDWLYYGVVFESEELSREILEKALSLNSPVAIRYPKYQSETPSLSSGDVSRWQEIEKGDKVTVLAVGPDCLNFAKNVAKEFKNKVQVFNARSIKPLDYDALQSITNRVVITIEENSLIGGFGSLINGYYSQSQVKVINLGVQDLFVAHATRKEQMQDNKVDYKTLYDIISKFC